MSGTSVTIGRPGQFEQFRRFAVRALEQASLRATDRAAREAVRNIRADMRRAKLGRLGNAIGAGSDKAKTGAVYRRGKEEFSASGWLHIRGRSERTLGVIEAYTEGADIRPRKGAWLWIPTQQVQQKVGRQRMTPALYQKAGFEERLGPLVFIQRSPAEAWLIVENVSVDKFGRHGRRARRLPKSGRARGARRKADFVVAFVGLRRTSRAARIDPTTIIAAAAARVPDFLGEELAKEI